MALIFWIVAMVCCSLANAECTSNCPHTNTRHIRNMQKTTCKCDKFVKDHTDDEHCIDFRFKIVEWVENVNQSFNGSHWPHCALEANDSPELMSYDWIGMSAESYSGKIAAFKLARGGAECYVLLVILTFLLFVLVAAIFQQQKRKNMTIKDLESRNDNLTRTIEVYKRQCGLIEING